MKTVLSFDGGGVRGAISVAFLARIERLMCPAGGDALADKIDLAGGTSTGAIIAGAVALGHSAGDIASFYRDLAPRIFRRSRYRIPLVQPIFHAGPLKEEVVKVCGERTLESEDLKTGFAVVMKRMDTGSVWIVSNNRDAPYWNDPTDGSYVGNRHFKLANLVRASTAAPHYFAPEPVEIVRGQPPGLFVDGGVSPHNNPSLALLQLVTIPAFGYGWPVGDDHLRIVSIGTGTYRDRLDARKARRMSSVSLATKALAGMINDGELQILTTMQLMGKSRIKWTINSEIGDLGGFRWPARPLFDFVRYDVRLEADWLKRELGIALSERQIEDVRRIDNPAAVPVAFEIGQAAAEKLVKAEHFHGPEKS